MELEGKSNLRLNLNQGFNRLLCCCYRFQMLWNLKCFTKMEKEKNLYLILIDEVPFVQIYRSVRFYL